MNEAESKNLKKRGPVKIVSDITGKIFGRWTVLRFSRRAEIGWSKFWVCRCECGIQREVIGGNLKSGFTKSCGCLKKEMREKRITHGFSRRNSTRTEYRIWGNIRQRCLNPNNPKFHDYGGRGIKVCDRWEKSFEEFFKDMGKRPSKELTVGRMDNDGNYEPSNCRWETSPQQVRNKRNNVLLTYKGETLCRHEMAAKYGLRYFTLRTRLSKGMTIEQAIETPVGIPGRHIKRNSNAEEKGRLE